MTTPSKTATENSKKPSIKRQKLSKNIQIFERTFLKRLQNTAHQFDLWQKNEKIIVAVSGGPDSICLLDCLVRLAKKYHWQLHIAHVNYRLREKDSDSDEAFVQTQAIRYNLPLSVFHPKQPQTTSNLEEQLRNVRYAFFETLRVEKDFDSIAIAHHRDDQTETFLLRLLRGSGLRGLGAMRPKYGHIIRPLLLTPKKDILIYLKHRKCSFCIDRTNTSPVFTRNRIRHELLPFLEHFNPNIRETLSKTALSLADDADALTDIVQQTVTHTLLHKEKLSNTVCTKENCVAVFSATTLKMLHPSLERAFLRDITEKITHNTQTLSFNETEELRKLIHSTKKKSSEKTIRCLKFKRKDDTVSVFTEA